MAWSKRIIHWTEGKDAFLSIPFTWLLPSAYSLAVNYKGLGYEVHCGGPAVQLMPEYLQGVSLTNGVSVDALSRHNPNATFTSRGCIRRCQFCAVPRIEGCLVELADWEPKPIVCDNNLLACSRKHFDSVIDRLKGIKGVDFNQGLDHRLLTKYHAGRIAELDIAVIRLAWDDIKAESKIMKAIGILNGAGFKNSTIRVYVLAGFEDTPEDAHYRCETLKSMDILPNPQRYQPLDTLVKDKYVGLNWNKRELERFMRYWARQVWLGHIPFNDYKG